MQPLDIFVLGRKELRIRPSPERHDFPGRPILKVESDDLGSTLLHLEAKESARRSDVQNPLSGQVDAAEVRVELLAEVPPSVDVSDAPEGPSSDRRNTPLPTERPVPGRRVPSSPRHSHTGKQSNTFLGMQEAIRAKLTCDGRTSGVSPRSVLGATRPRTPLGLRWRAREAFPGGSGRAFSHRHGSIQAVCRPGWLPAVISRELRGQLHRKGARAFCLARAHARGFRRRLRRHRELFVSLRGHVIRSDCPAGAPFRLE